MLGVVGVGLAVLRCLPVPPGVACWCCGCGPSYSCTGTGPKKGLVCGRRVGVVKIVILVSTVGWVLMCMEYRIPGAMSFLTERSPSVGIPKIFTSAVVAHECLVAFAAGSGMPMRIQADSCTATDRCRARIEVVLSEAAGAARNRCKTLVNVMRRAHRRRAGEGRAASSPSSARFESQPVSGRACPS